MKTIVFCLVPFMSLKNKLELPINREKSGIRRLSSFELLGHAFYPPIIRERRQSANSL